MNWYKRVALLATAIILILFPVEGQNSRSKLYSEISEEQWLPNYSITSIFQDSKGYLWIGTNAGLFKYDGLTTKNYSYTDQGKNTLSNNTIKDIAEDRAGNIWVATAGGLDIIHQNSQVIELYLGEVFQNLQVDDNGIIWATPIYASDILYKIDPKKPRSKNNVYLDKNDAGTKLIGGSIRHIHRAANGNMWLGSAKGIFLLDSHKKEVYGSNFSFSVTKIYADSKGIIWVGTENNGLFALKPNITDKRVLFDIVKRYNLGESQEASYNKISVLTGLQSNYLIAGTFNHLYLSNLSPFPENNFLQAAKTARIFQDSNVQCIFVDKEQNIWVGTLLGLYKLKNQNYLFNRIKLATPDYIPINNNIVKLSSDRNGIIWAISNSDGLFKYNPEKEEISRIQAPFPEKIKGLQQASDGDYLVNIGTDLYKYSGSINTLLEKEKLKLISGNINGFQAALEDSPGNWWLGTWEHGILAVSENNASTKDSFLLKVTRLMKEKSHVSSINKDSKNNIWIGYRGTGIMKANRATNSVKHYQAGRNGLLSDRIISIYHDKKGQTWVATRGQGIQIYDETSDTFKAFTTDNGLPSNTVCAFGEDENNDLWVSTQNGLAKYLPKQVVPFQFYGLKDGIIHTEFTFNTSTNGINKHLYFGNSNGIYHIEANNINNTVRTAKPLVITSLNILTTGSNPELYEQSKPVTIQKQGNIQLPHSKNSFSISFSSLDFTSPEKIKYAYRLKGYDASWIYTDAEKRTVQYVNIPASNYTFQVKSSDSEGVWNNKPVSFSLTIAPPFWLSPKAYFLYSILFLLIIFTGFIFIRRWYSLKLQLKDEAAVLQLQTQQMVYFSDLSHEIKNRLTLILGPLETALSGKKVNKAILNNLYEQALRLKRINEQIINIRKSEAGEFLLSVQEGDIKQYVAEVCERVKPLALVRNIELEYIYEKEEMPAWFDQELLEIILLNLLTNAIKYSEPGTKVTIKFGNLLLGANEDNNNKPGNYIYGVIEDTGMGIPSDALKYVTEPFFRANNVVTSTEGTGLGLNLVQRLIGRHHGWMKINSKENEFTSIQFYLPADKEKYAIDELQPSLEHTPIVEALDVAEKPVAISKPVMGQVYKPLILIVDDEAEIRKFIRECLLDEFEISEASNGEAAYQQLLTEPIELVVTDLSMPLLDGISLLKRIKLSAEFSDIPVIILTGKSAENEKLQCLENNADEYIEKPFSPELLRWRIKNLLNTRQVLKDKFIRKIAVISQTEEITNELSADEKFIQEVVEFTEKNLSNVNLNVEFLAECMCMSRATLYRKMEELLGESPSNFIRKTRLKRAAILLKEGKFNISEVSYKVGTKSPNHFTKTFHKEFGISPTDFMKLENKENIIASI